MTKDDMGKEIEELRAQVSTLTAEREARAKEDAESQNKARETESATQESEAAGPAVGEAEIAVPEDADLSKMFQELVETVDTELKQASPMTVVVVFALGVLVGRLLPR